MVSDPGMMGPNALAAMLMACEAVRRVREGESDWVVAASALFAAAALSMSQRRRRKVRISAATVIMHVLEQVALRERRPNVHRDRGKVLAQIRALTDAEFARQYRLPRTTFYRLLDQVSPYTHLG